MRRTGFFPCQVAKLASKHGMNGPRPRHFGAADVGRDPRAESPKAKQIRLHGYIVVKLVAVVVIGTLPGGPGPQHVAVLWARSGAEIGRWASKERRGSWGQCAGRGSFLARWPNWPQNME
jgi:hypothetical protein